MKRFVLLISLIATILSMNAQNDTIISFVNIYPGHDIYELEGHSALRIQIGQQEDYAISYGQFDFNAPNFIYRFVKGETDYMVAAIPWKYFEDAYRRDGRRMVAHRLDMTQEQKTRLIQLVNENLLPANATYRYNYVKDNCATRPLKIVENAMSDTILLGVTGWDDNPTSFRDVMRYYHSNYPWYQFGIDLALGSGIDYPLNRREYAFAPVILDEQIINATINSRPLISHSEVIINVAPDNVIEPPTPWYLSPLFVCWLVFCLILWVSITDLRKHQTTRWIDAIFFCILGLAGLLLTFLIFISVHEATSPNWLYVWINPLCLIPTIFIWLKKCKTIVLSYHFLNFAVLFILCVSWWALPQSANPAFLPLILADMLRSATYIRLNYKRYAA